MRILGTSIPNSSALLRRFCRDKDAADSILDESLQMPSGKLENQPLNQHRLEGKLK